jgi:hypothetical protein
MRTQTGFCVFVSSLALACALGAEDVRVTVFSLKTGKEVEAIRFSSTETEGQVVFTITQTDGGRALVFGADVVNRAEKMVSVDTLPPGGQKFIADSHAADAARAARRKEAEAAELERQRAANERAAAVAKAYQDDKPRRDALNAALADYESIRARCAQLWEQWRVALARQREAEDLRTRATTRYDAARAELAGVSSMQPRCRAEEQDIRASINNLRAELDRLGVAIAAADSDARAAAEDVRALQETLGLGKQRLAAAQVKIDDLRAKAPVGITGP